MNNSVAALATDLLGDDKAILAVKWLIVGGLLITGLCDLAAIFVVLIAHKPRLGVGRWRWVLGWGGRARWQPGWLVHRPACLALTRTLARLPASLVCPPTRLPVCSIRNYLYSAWVHDHAYKLHVVCAGLMITVICLVGDRVERG